MLLSRIFPKVKKMTPLASKFFRNCSETMILRAGSDTSADIKLLPEREKYTKLVDYTI